MPPAGTANPLACHFGKSISNTLGRRGFLQKIQNPVIFTLTTGLWKYSKSYRNRGLIAFEDFAVCRPIADMSGCVYGGA